MYEVIKKWSNKEYHLEGKTMVKTILSGGDFEKFKYPENCVVIDNPPFSILAKIKQFYVDRGIKFFLFLHHLLYFPLIKK